MKDAIQFRRLFAAVLSISVACILFGNQGCTEGKKVTPELVMEEGAVGQVVYVKQGGTGDGTKEDPMGDINQAIAHAKATWSSPSEVHVAKGTYNVDSSAGTQIKMEEGVSLKGGYLAGDWENRDPSTNVTKIEDISATELSGEVNRAVEAGSGVTAATVIDGFVLQGCDTRFSSAIFVNDAAPTISNNTIHAGNFAGSSESEVVGILNKDSSPTIYNNTINGSTTKQLMTGGIYNYDSSGTIDGNVINGGSGSNAAGISNDSNSSPKIYNNIIDGGLASGSRTYGISNDENSSPAIYNNTIDGGKGSYKSYGIFNMNGSSPAINNNIIFTTGSGTRYGIYEIDASSDPTEVKNNDIFDCPDALYYDFDSATKELTTLSAVNALSEAEGNVEETPAFVSATDWHLTASSPASVKQGGLDVSSEFTTDKDGNTRTAPWSMGAYELD